MVYVSIGGVLYRQFTKTRSLHDFEKILKNPLESVHLYPFPMLWKKKSKNPAGCGGGSESAAKHPPIDTQGHEPSVKSRKIFHW